MRPALFGCLAALMLLAFSCGGGNSGGSVTIVPNGTPTETSAPSDPTPTLAPGETPAPTNTPNPGNGWSSPLPCGDILVPVDKEFALAEDCAPGSLVVVPERYSWGTGHELTPDAMAALAQLLDAAAADGFDMYVASAYRSYQTQAATFQNWVAQLGQEQAERISARPGHSEHQLGTTADLTVTRNEGNLDAFAGTPEAEWVAQNAWRFGFVVTYPPDGEPVTGYVWEPWHIRYVGEEVAAQIRESGLIPGIFLRNR